MSTHHVSFLGHHSKCHRLCNLNAGNLFFPSSGGWKSEIYISARLVPSQASLLDLTLDHFPPVCIYVLISSSSPNTQSHWVRALLY